MKKTLTTISVVAIAVMLSAAAQAQEVIGSVLIDPSGPGTFEVRLSSSVGDNDGIVSYAVTLTGGIIEFDHNSPSATFASSPNPGGAGFSFVRANEAAGPGSDVFGPALISASQNAGPGGNINLIAGFGLTASDFAASGITVGFAGDEPQAWDADLLIASGTYTGAAPGIDFGQSSATVWSVFNGPSAAGVIVGAPIVPIPEPATLALGLISLVGIVSLRRRS